MSLLKWALIGGGAYLAYKAITGMSNGCTPGTMTTQAEFNAFCLNTAGAAAAANPQAQSAGELFCNSAQCNNTYYFTPGSGKPVEVVANVAA